MKINIKTKNMPKKYLTTLQIETYGVNRKQANEAANDAIVDMVHNPEEWMRKNQKNLISQSMTVESSRACFIKPQK